MDVATPTTVTLCGRLADRVGSAILIDIPLQGCTVAQLRRNLTAAYPTLAAELASSRVRFCVDGCIVTESANVLPHQDIAVFPPVSGG